MTKITIEEKLDQLGSMEKIQLGLAKEMLSSVNGIYFMDYLTTGVINRCIDLNYGFITLIKSKNYIAAAHLARPQLDNYLRYNAAWLVSDPHQFVKNILDGIAVNKQKDRNGKLMRDAYLVDLASIEYPWIRTVYSQTSGFIHLSDKHIMTSIETTLEEGKDILNIKSKIGKGDKFVPEESKYEALECMIEISNCINKLIEGWIWSKNNPDQLSMLR